MAADDLPWPADHQKDAGGLLTKGSGTVVRGTVEYRRPRFLRSRICRETSLDTRSTEHPPVLEKGPLFLFLLPAGTGPGRAREEGQGTSPLRVGSRDESLAGPQGGALSPRRAFTIPLFDSNKLFCSWCRFEHGWVHYFYCAKNVNRVGEKRQCLFATICSYCFSRFPRAIFFA